MKVSSLLIAIVVGGIMGFVLAKFVSSHKSLPQKKITHLPLTHADQWQWADSLDALKAAPNSHKVLFENDKIRVLEVILKPYADEPMHTHRYPSIMFGNNNGDTSQFDIVYYRYGLDSVHHQYFVKDSIHQHNGAGKDASTDAADFMQPEGPHRVKNLSNGKIDVYRVELKDNGKQ